MVATRNSSVEVHVDENTRNYVTSVVTPLNEKIDNLSTRIEELMLARQYNHNGEGTSRETVTWGVYVEVVFKRFESVNEDPMAELKNLSMFIAGLPSAIELNVRMFRPSSLSDAFSLASLQEATLAVIKQKNTPILPTPRPASNWNANRNTNYAPKTTTATMVVHVPNTQTVNKYSRHMFAMEIKGMEGDECLEEDDSDMIEYELSETPHISLNALSRVHTHNTMRSATLHLMQCSEGHDNSLNEEINQLLEEYADVFTMPKELPLYRSFDHKIPLKTDNVSVNIRPYRYPPTQKNTIETMIKELLDSRIVRLSNSPFLSLIVLVKKKDGSRRMCIDYRHLNKNTIKDKFPILVIEELIDELHGAMVFSKLDLRSGYQQIRMCEEDIYKTAFKSHEGHYEFVVMHFGLINAPSTFQALMNSVFKPFLRKFTLVFFDDILVYSPSPHNHIQHLRLVLQTMRDNTLFAKKSKWRGYLLDRHFKTKTDHFSLKYMLDQRITTPFPSKWLPKFLGFDYDIEYKKGVDNAAADALSRIKGKWSCSTSKYVWHNHQLRKKDKWVVGQDMELRNNLVAHFHSSAIGGHSGVQATTKRLTTYFYWKGLRKMVKEWDCVVEAVDKTLVAREQTLKLLHFNLKKAQDRMKSQADKGRSDMEFQVNDWVYLKLQPYRQLPHYAKVHPVFHVSQLKPCYVEAATIGKFPQCDDEGLLAASPLNLLERKIVKQNNEMVVYGLI
nr:putative mitochondrial protein [Tanacetum cinerariifolium]